MGRGIAESCTENGGKITHEPIGKRLNRGGDGIAEMGRGIAKSCTGNGGKIIYEPIGKRRAKRAAARDRTAAAR
eukprot:scaffold302357_cov43-Tisochrysis_lutea.AAC.1